MANQFYEHVWVIDTASSTPIVPSATREQPGDTVRISLVRWVVTGSGVAGDNVQIANGESVVLWEDVNTTGSAQFAHESAAPLILRGLTVPVLDRGKLYLYLDINRE